jgi:Ca2+-binding RTX toxin-like protein/predicted glycoside hydrolase/deacetylase ChbG (UPF0249 family)
MSNDYTLKLHIENPGTIYHGKNGDHESRAGHVWYEVKSPDGTVLQAGFAPIDDKNSLFSSAPGKVYNNDGAAYKGNSNFSATFKITSGQYNQLVDYAKFPEKYGFDKGSYYAPTNSCVDYVWNGLRTIGMNPTGYQGKLWPEQNDKVFANLKNPAFADGGLLLLENKNSCLNPALYNLDSTTSDMYKSGLITSSQYNGWASWMSDTLVNDNGAQIFPVPKPDPIIGIDLAPIGAFYESVSPAADTAASIADKTPVLLDANNHGLTVDQLAARDTNNDGQLTGAELTNMSAWTDLNQNGILDAGELTTLANASITALNAARGDYTFYTQGNGNPGTGVAATPTINQTAPTLTVPASNYRSLRDTGNHRTIAMGTIEDEVWLINGQRIVTKSHYGETQWIDWSANQIKQSNDNTALIGTDGADTFDASYYSATSWLPSSGLVNFMAGGGDDLMGGSTRSDNLWGGTGNDVLFGYAGDDKLYGEDGDDQLQGGEGADSLAGGLGNDALLGQAGNDILVGNEGNDELQGNEGNDWLTGDSGNDKLFGQVGNDQLWGGDGEDVLVGFTASNEAKQSLATGETDNDTLIGGAGNDYLLGGLGDDQLDGGSGQDEITGDAGHDRIMAGSEDDRVFGGVGDDQIWGGDGNDVLVGFTASNDAQQTLNAGETDHDKIYAGAGNDLILGGWGDDQIYGEDGDDIALGGDGDDQMYGGAGDDRLFGEVGDDVIYGGEGDDVILGFTPSNADKQTLNAGEPDNDHLYGGAGHDILMGGLGNDYLDGGAGADDMMGGAGDDTYMVNSVNDSIVEGRNEGYDTVISSTNYQLNQNIEELRLLEGYNIHGTGNALNNKIMGNSADNILDGITGADTLMGGLGNDTYYVDNAGDQVLENQNEGTDTVQTSISYTLADNLENLNLLDFSKPELGRVTGSDGVAMPALIYGFPKRFELDYLQGDEVDGFQGTCALTSIANLLTLSGKPTTEGEVVRRAIDNQWARIDPSLPAWQRGGSNAYEQQQLLTSYGLRNDMIAGYNETGIANLVRSGRGVIVAVDAGIIWESTLYQTGQVNHAVTLTGVVYKESDGSLLGFYITDSGRAKVSDMTRFIPIDLFRQAANVPGAYALYTIAPVKLWDEDIDGTGNAGDNQIIGNRGDNQLFGLAGNDTLAGGAGNDTLDGGAGADTLAGGEGHDTYVVDNTGDNVTENADEGVDTVQSNVSFTLGANVENLALTGTANLSGTGNELDNVLTGNSANNTLTGGAGNDWLDGGAGADALIGGTGDDSYVVDNTGDNVTENADEGVDTVQSNVSFTLGANVENLALTGTANLSGTGNGLNNVLTGNSGNNTLTGGGGNDTLDGGAGADTLVGGAGDDTYTVDNVGDIVTENANEGLDSVQASVSTTLSANVENLVLTGYADISGTGNAGANTLRGNAGDNTLSGGAGDDTYIFTTGFGQDTIIEDDATAGNTDTVRFTTGILATNVRVRRNGNDLLLVAENDGTATLKDWYVSDAKKVERVEFADGTAWTVAQLKQMANSAPTGSVTVGGESSVGRVLTATNGLSDADGLGVMGYQWQASNDNGATWANITGATASNFTLTSAQLGKPVRVVVTYTDGAGVAESVASGATNAVAVFNNHVPTGVVSVVGTATQGQTLTASQNLVDTDGLGTVAFKWQSSVDNGVTWGDIAGATGSAFTLTQAQVGKKVRSVASYTDGQGTVETVASAASAVIANVNDTPTGGVTLTGTASQNQTLLINTSALMDADGLGTLNTQWQVSADNGASWSNLSGATASTFNLTQSQVGKKVRAQVSYTDGFGVAETVFSAATAAVANVNDAPTGSVTLTGTMTQGQTLQANTTGLADADGLGTLNTQWQVSADNGATWSNITGANSSAYTLAAAQTGKRVRVVTRYTDGQGTAETVNSVASDVIGQAVNGLVGSSGTEWLNGTAGNDVFDGKGGIDIMDGGGGYDTYTGGDGEDVFVIRKKAGMTDTITDFVPITDCLLLVGFKVRPSFVQEGAHTRVRLDDGQSILLQNVVVSQMNSNSYTQVETYNGVGQVVFEWPVGYGDSSNQGGWNGSPTQRELIIGRDRNSILIGDNPNTGTAGGDDIIDGGSNSDVIAGGAGNDQLRGGSGVDYIQGDAGDDTIYLEGDYLGDVTTQGYNAAVRGGTGKDRFVLDQPTANSHVTFENFIWDFEVGAVGAPVDKIDLSRIAQAHAWSDLSISSGNLTIGDGMPITEIRINGDPLDRVVTLYNINASQLRAEHFIFSTLNRPTGGNYSISGSTAQNGVLTLNASGLTDADGMGALSYQWQVSADNGVTWSDIGGATSSSISFTQFHVSKSVRVAVSYTDGAGTRETALIPISFIIANVNDTPSGLVSITGTAQEGRVFTVGNTLADADGLGAVSYQWQVCADNGVTWTNITGATASTLTLTQAQVGKQVRAVASYTDGYGTAESVTSAASAMVANVNDAPTGNVTLSGNATQNAVLTANFAGLADADGLGVLSTQWQVSNGSGANLTWSNITGATASTLTLTQAQVGKQVRAVASYTDGYGTAESVTSAASATVANVNDAPTGNVTLSGNATQNAVLTANFAGLADADGLGVLSTQWQVSNGSGANLTWSNITGATASTLTLTQAQVGKQVRAVASYTDGYGTAESVALAASDVIANVNDTPTGSVTFSGTLTQGQTLTASHTLADADGLGTISYKWQMSGDNGLTWADIAGATGSTLVLTQAQVGKQIRTLASYTDGFGSVESVASSASGMVSNANDAPTGGVTITGESAQYQVLTTCHTLTDSDGLGTVSYQWQVSSDNGITWSNISGATGVSYTLTQAEVGKRIRSLASYTDGFGSMESVASSASGMVSNANDAPTGGVTITGESAQYQVLTTCHTLTDSDGLGTVSYQWQVSSDNGITWSNISGATGVSYTLTQAEVGKRIRSLASYTDGFGSMESVASTASDVIENVNDAATGTVTLSGIALQNQVLSAAHSLADVDGMGTVSYQWQSSGDGGVTWTNITGASASTLTLTQAQVGGQVRVLARYTDALGTPEWVASTATAVVANVNDVPTGSVTLSGTSVQNQVLTANNTLADADGLGLFNYQWQVSSGSGSNLTWSNISGATQGSYTLGQAEVGAQVRVITSYTDRHGAIESFVSTSTDVVANVNDTPRGEVTIAGVAAQKQVLRASNTLVDADGLGTVSYKWQVSSDNGFTWSNISGATAVSFTLTQAQVGKKVRAVASYTDGYGAVESVSSAASDVIANVNDAPTGSVTLSGWAAQNQVLTVSNTLADADGKGTVSYQWQVSSDNGLTWSNISGATAATFTLTQAEVGKKVRSRASYTDGFGTVESVASAASAVVGVTVTGTSGSDSLLGTAGADVLNALAGGDTLNGGAGADKLAGGAGNDIYVVDNVGDVVTENPNEGTDTVQTSVSYTLSTNVENLQLTGTAAINGTGNALNNVLTGNAANNILNGGAGLDTLIGGAGNDTYVVDNVGDVVTENLNEGTDTVQTSVSYTLSTNVENLQLTGTAAINGTGNALNNALTGNAANNILNGGAGNDTINAGAGADTLIGGLGNDSLQGGAGNDTYLFARGDGADIIIENDTKAGNADILQFAAGIDVNQLWFRQSGNHLVVSIIGGADSATINNWYLGSQYHVEQFKAAGNTLLNTDVAKLVSAMAAFTPPAAGQTTLSTDYQATLNPIIAANWR